MKQGKWAVSILALTGIFFFLLSGGGTAQEKFPTRSIQFIIPWAPGGGGTINAQALQPHFEKAIQGSVQIINKPGGGRYDCLELLGQCCSRWIYRGDHQPEFYFDPVYDQDRSQLQKG